ncbi:hypothetical protein FRB94_013400 [Tulasnella sp. JGI-2019a]|nr:hypothetical protein FRB93_002488 [Tulasnella sp. JGI-2019a]KAG9008353.1 hypothetical protein FRB94_013400 [Tulasnella sp. JGI-2019a]KAG9037801.1 hypothetical protein FRB95_004088 [Tulasnella sp. JGI-2019a]
MFQSIFTGLWSRRRRSKVVVWVTISLFLITTVNIALCITYEYDAWIKYRVSPGVEAYYANGTWSTIKSMQYTLTFIAGTVADILVCWRLYAIWNKSLRLVLFPAILLVITTVIAFAMSITSIAIHSNTGGPKYFTFFLTGEIMTTAGTVLVNIYSTSLIIIRLWRIGSRTQTPQGRGIYNYVIVLVFQSGALQTTVLLVYTGFSFTGHFGASAFLLYILIMVIAISPLLIVIQLEQKVPSEPDSTHRSTADDEPANKLNETSNAGLGAALKRRSKEIRSPPVGRVVLSPIDFVELRTFHPSELSHSSRITQTSSPTSVGENGNGKRGGFIMTIGLADSKKDVRLQLQEDMDIDV